MMAPRTYEITFAGEAIPAIVSAFEEFEVTIQAGKTALRGELPDQAALYGIMNRLQDLGLELLEVRVVSRPAAQKEPRNQRQTRPPTPSRVIPLPPRKSVVDH
jgi:hypothetical protein